MEATFTAEQFNQAMRVTLEWGPNRMIPETERLARLAPEMSLEQMHAAFERCATVERMAYDLAPKIKRDGVMQTRATELLLQAFPGLEPDLASQAIHQGLYYHWKDEGY